MFNTISNEELDELSKLRDAERLGTMLEKINEGQQQEEQEKVFKPITGRIDKIVEMIVKGVPQKEIKKEIQTLSPEEQTILEERLEELPALEPDAEDEVKDTIIKSLETKNPLFNEDRDNETYIDLANAETKKETKLDPRTKKKEIDSVVKIMLEHIHHNWELKAENFNKIHGDSIKIGRASCRERV